MVKFTCKSLKKEPLFVGGDAIEGIDRLSQIQGRGEIQNKYVITVNRIGSRAGATPLPPDAYIVRGDS